MARDSKYFDMIRIKPRGAKAAPAASEHPKCNWKGCTGAGAHKAPRGRGHDGEFYLFCAEHVAKYNASYNYFDGMSDAEVEGFQREASYGHRPTWKVGANAWAHGTRADTSPAEQAKFEDARNAGAQGFHAWRARQERQQARTPKRKMKPLEQKSLDTLGVSMPATPEQIKSRYKELVKVHHPDANGGDRGTEEKLREIIQAYNYLKQVGLA